MRRRSRAIWSALYGPIGLKTVLEAAQRAPALEAPLGRNQGRGFACGFWFNAGMNSSATVTLDSDGSAAVMTGNPDIGGTRVAQALMVAEELGISPSSGPSERWQIPTQRGTPTSPAAAVCATRPAWP